MTKEQPDYLQFPLVGDTPESLAALVAQVLRGEVIENVRLHSLRALIEAVQAHPDAKLAPPKEQRGKDWRPPSSLDENALNHLQIAESEILDGDFQALDVRVTLSASAYFGGDAQFDGATFGGDANFGRATFVGDADFGSATFGGHARFVGATFVGDARFFQVTFGGHASFVMATFGDHTGFDGATFGGPARFDKANFGGHTGFDGAIFGGPAQFDRVTFAKEATFDRSRFQKEVDGKLALCFLRTAKFGEAAKVEPTGRTTADSNESWSQRTRRSWRNPPDAQRFLQLPGQGRLWWRRWRRRTFGWQIVRSLGQLAILNSVSLFALVAIPVLVAFWPAVDAFSRAYHKGLSDTHAATQNILAQVKDAGTDAPGLSIDIERRIGCAVDLVSELAQKQLAKLENQVPEHPHISPSLAFTFFAAVAVTIGQLVYQVRVPDEIRKHDLDSFVDSLHLRYPEQAKDRNDGLRRAIEHLERRAEQRADCHRSFVTHHNDTIWVPPRDRIDWFEDLPSLPSRARKEAVGTNAEPVVAETDAQQPPDASKPESRFTETTTSPSESVPDNSSARTGMVPGAERRRIVIEEGAKAEYWLKSRENIRSAWSSFTFYVIGISCLLFVLWEQICAVWEKTGW